MNPPLRVHLIRHGETAWSLTGQHTGRTDLPLTLHGEQMARDLAPLLAKTSFSVVLTSPRLRARATCALAGFGAAAVSEPKLAEWDYGEYEGMRTSEIQSLHPDWDVWRDGCPGGERPEEASNRADLFIEQLLGFAGNVLLFSHGQFGRVLAARWIGLPAFQGQHFTINPASISIFGFEPDHPQRRVISLWNATSQRLG
jgi:broad specificity phosphatase PhoE